MVARRSLLQDRGVPNTSGPHPQKNEEPSRGGRRTGARTRRGWRLQESKMCSILGNESDTGTEDPPCQRRSSASIVIGARSTNRRPCASLLPAAHWHSDGTAASGRSSAPRPHCRTEHPKLPELPGCGRQDGRQDRRACRAGGSPPRQAPHHPCSSSPFAAMPARRHGDSSGCVEPATDQKPGPACRDPEVLAPLPREHPPAGRSRGMPFSCV